MLFNWQAPDHFARFRTAQLGNIQVASGGTMQAAAHRVLQAILALVAPLATAQDNCLPVVGNWTWTADEINSNRRAIDSIEAATSAKVDPPVIITNWNKYKECTRWMTDHHAAIFYDLLQAHDDAAVTKRFFDIGVGGALAYTGAALFTGLVAKVGAASLLQTHGGNILDDWVFGTEPEKEFADAAWTTFKALKAANPNDSDGQLLQKLKDRLTTWKVQSSTLNWLDDTLVKVIVREKVLGNDSKTPTIPNAEARARQSLKRVDDQIKAHQSTISKTIDASKRVAEAGGKTFADSASRSDWDALNKKYRELQSTHGGATDAAIQAAATDEVKRKALKLSKDDVDALANELARKAVLREGIKSANELKQNSAELANLSMNLQWDEGARVFSELSASADAYGKLLGALAGSALGPPGPMQYVAAANAVFSIGGSLSRVFGGRGGGGDDGLARALKQIFAALRSLSEQLRDLRKEQRENFEYAQRHLEVLIELSSGESLNGVEACRRMNFTFAQWGATTGGRDIRAAIEDRKTAPSLMKYAMECKTWLTQARSYPFTANGVNVLYKQRLQAAAAVAGRYQQQTVEFKNKGFLLTEEYFPSLLSLIDQDKVTVAFQDRAFIFEPVEDQIDIGPRMQKVNFQIGSGWKLSNHVDQLLSSATIATVAESVLLMKPAAALLSNATSIGEIDQSYGQFADTEREFYGLILVSLAQERLMSGAPLAEVVDDVLTEDDQRETLARLESCGPKGSAARVACAIKMNVPADFDFEACTPVPDPAKTSLCAKWGRNQFNARVAAAVASLKAFPTLRQNVLAVRLWRAAHRSQNATNWTPAYASAWTLGDSTSSDAQNDAGSLVLSKMFRGLDVRRLSTQSPVGPELDPYLAKGRYFVRLAGRCEGMKHRALSGITECSNLVCTYDIGKDEEGKTRVIKTTDKAPKVDGDKDDPKACIVAALPEPEDFQSGALLRTGGALRLERLSSLFAMSIGFDKVFQSLTNDDRATLLKYYRPVTASSAIEDQLAGKTIGGLSK
jgi:hypothetical protein